MQKLEVPHGKKQTPLVACAGAIGSYTFVPIFCQ